LQRSLIVKAAGRRVHHGASYQQQLRQEYIFGRGSHDDERKLLSFDLFDPSHDVLP
jgi:hypothetical protein